MEGLIKNKKVVGMKQNRGQNHFVTFGIVGTIVFVSLVLYIFFIVGKNASMDGSLKELEDEFYLYKDGVRNYPSEETRG